MNEFLDCYCSEPRLAFNRPVFLRYRSTWNNGTSLLQRLTCAWPPVRRVAYEAADSGLLSRTIDSADAGGKLRLGNWLTADQGRSLLLNSRGDSLRSNRNYAILALLIGCGLTRGELLALSAASIQLREEHWVIADLHGKAGHIRTVPIPL